MYVCLNFDIIKLFLINGALYFYLLKTLLYNFWNICHFCQLCFFADDHFPSSSSSNFDDDKVSVFSHFFFVS